MGKVGLVVMDSVVRDADVAAGWDVHAVNGDAARVDLAGNEAWHAGGEAHSFVDAGAEIVAVAEDGVAADVFDGGEGRADLGLKFCENVGVMQEVEDCACYGCGGVV